MKGAERIEHIKEYYFSKKLSEINQLIKQGKPIINLGIGSPDLMPPTSVIEAMTNATKQKENHGYQSYRGILELRKTISDFYKKYYQVEINPENEVIPLMGSKEGIMHISMAFLNTNDKVLIPNPGYMTYQSATLLAGGKPIYYNLKEENNWLPDLKRLSKLNLDNVKLMWINYPHMPTGAKANDDFFKEIIAFAKTHNILVINDNPYSFILNDEPLSLLKYDQSFNNILELNSLSKSHNMAGWRVGMLLGKKEHIDNVMKFKSNMDSGMFLGTQLAAIEALNQPKEWFRKINETYKKRKIIAKKIFDSLDISYQKNQVGLFLWGKLPNHQKSKEFSDWLLYKKHIFMAPGFIFGSNGDNYIRLSLTNDEKTLEQVLKRLEK